MANEFTARVAGISVELGMSVQNKSGIWCKPKDVVYDATNLKASYRVEFLDTLRLLNCKKVCVFVDTPFEVCIRRNEERERTVPKEAMERMKRFLEPPTFAEGWDEIRVVKNWNEKENSDGGDR